jgi:DnaJ family protein C protein 2
MASKAPTGKKNLNLFDYTEDQLLHDNELTHYEVLNLELYATSDNVKKAYRRASLKYHPDKTGRGDDDYVFLAVKAAYDCLMDPLKRQAYDSTELPFDDAIPASREKLLQDSMLLYKDEDFYATFGPVFEINYRFDAKLRSDVKNNGKKKSQQQNGGKSEPPPSLGDETTPIEQVHKFYEYWVHFDSWRDFSAQAADELQMENELENAESRYEKRWIEKEVGKRAKQLKKLEMNRIQTLVERAMEADPRLRRERQEERERKEQAKKQRELDVLKKQEAELERQRQAERQEEIDKQRRAEEKVEREQQKKQIRKARQQLRRMTSESFTENESAKELWADAYDMNQDVEFLCSTLSLEELAQLNEEYEKGTCDKKALEMILQKAKEQKQADEQPAAECTGETSNTNATANLKAQFPWTKDELSALAKAVKKYPPGGGSRWEQIALFVNNICKQDEPRSKEECIEKYNQIARNAAKPPPSESGNGSSSMQQDASPPHVVDTTTAIVDDDWTAEQDQLLQDGLAQFAATMDKNERWTLIAKAVPGKSKKECVQRFKAIREALKNRK